MAPGGNLNRALNHVSDVLAYSHLKKTAPINLIKVSIFFYGINHSVILFGIHTDINETKLSLIYFRINEMALRAPLIYLKICTDPGLRKIRHSSLVCRCGFIVITASLIMQMIKDDKRLKWYCDQKTLLFFLRISKLCLRNNLHGKF